MKKNIRNINNYKTEITYKCLFEGYGFFLLETNTAYVKEISHIFFLDVMSRHSYNSIVAVTMEDVIKCLLLMEGSTIVQIVQMEKSLPGLEKAITEWGKLYGYTLGFSYGVDFFPESKDEPKPAMEELMSNILNCLPKKPMMICDHVPDPASIWTDGKQIICNKESAWAIAKFIDALGADTDVIISDTLNGKNITQTGWSCIKLKN